MLCSSIKSNDRKKKNRDIPFYILGRFKKVVLHADKFVLQIKT